MYAQYQAPEMGTPLRNQPYFSVVPLAQPDLSALSVDPTRVLLAGTGLAAFDGSYAGGVGADTGAFGGV